MCPVVRLWRGTCRSSSASAQSSEGKGAQGTTNPRKTSGARGSGEDAPAGLPLTGTRYGVYRPPMKIHVFVGNTRFTGGRQELFRHANALARRGHEVTVWTEANPHID